MSADIVCRVCLVKNMNLYSVQSDLQNVYERLTGEKYNRDGYPVHMCYICLTVLRKCHRFMETARDTNNVLKQWYKQQNEVREVRPLYTYSISKVESVSMYNENMTLQYEIKVESMESEQEEVQTERKTDVDIEKTDIDEQTYYSALWEDIHNDSPYTDPAGDDNDGQTDPLLHSKLETTSSASNLDDHTNIETIIKHEMSSPHDNDSPPVKKRKINETEPQHQAPETSRKTVANNETSNDITLSNSTPSQLDNIRHRTTKTKSTFDKNNRSSKETAKYKPFSCNFCDYKCSLKHTLVEHIRTHTGEKPFTCTFCNVKFRQKHHLIKHMRTQERTHIRTIGKKLLSCETCNYKSTNKTNFATHIRTHTGEKPFSCDICDYKCKRKHNLVQHMRTHTGEKPFSCDICDCKYGQKRHLVAHMRTHSGEKPFSCDICDYKSVQKCNLLRHMRTHTGEKLFSCDMCDYKCKRKDNLVQHMRTHTGEKPFSCDICDYKSAQKINLVVHLRTHTGEKPFSCDMCDYKCKQKHHLVEHMRNHPGEKLFSCDMRFNKFAN